MIKLTRENKIVAKAIIVRIIVPVVAVAIASYIAKKIETED